MRKCNAARICLATAILAMIMVACTSEGSLPGVEDSNKPGGAIQEYIANSVDQEEIDFSPSDPRRTRIIVGKSSDDTFFVANIIWTYGESVGDPSWNCLEVTKDFKTFTTIVKSDNASASTPGISIPGYDNFWVKSVKEFANGDFIVAASVKNLGCCFLLLKKDFSEISQMYCTYLDGTYDILRDEFGNDVYDWHINISGSKALVTTYGSRNPVNDYGRVWYTEDNGITWKQIFQMTNHYQDGVEGDIISRVHVHGVMIDDYSHKLYVIAGENNSNLFWSDKGINSTDNDWNVIPIRRDLPTSQMFNMQVVNGYAFENNLIFGSDNAGVGAIYRLDKLENDQYSRIQIAHEFLPNVFSGTYYCSAEMYRRDEHTPLFICETHENCRLTEEENEYLNEYHKARVVATYDGIHFTEIWSDDTFDAHETYIFGEGLTTRKFSLCTRGMCFYLLNNGDAVIKYSGRRFHYFGGDPMYSVLGNSKASSRIRLLKGIGSFF